MDLIRLILLEVEARHTRPGEPLTNLPVEGWPKAAVLYHVDLLAEAGLLNAAVDYEPDAHGAPSGRPTVLGLTWAGHEFLDSVRDPRIWQQTRSAALSAGGWTLPLLADLAAATLRTAAAPAVRA